MNNRSNLYVRLWKSMNIPGTCQTTGEPTPGNGDRFINVEVAYSPSPEHMTEEDKQNRENFDRDWLSILIGSNPTIDNLGAAVSSAAKSLIDMVKPANVSMSVTISGTADKNGFCEKTVEYYWDEKENA
jgi:hypothetical protein